MPVGTVQWLVVHRVRVGIQMNKPDITLDAVGKAGERRVGDVVVPTENNRERRLSDGLHVGRHLIARPLDIVGDGRRVATVSDNEVVVVDVLVGVDVMGPAGLAAEMVLPSTGGSERRWSVSGSRTTRNRTVERNPDDADVGVFGQLFRFGNVRSKECFDAAECGSGESMLWVGYIICHCSIKCIGQ
jgi:hypothetical protein